MSGTNGMQGGGMQGAPQMGTMPQGAFQAPQVATPQAGMMQPAIPQAQMGGQMPTQMGQSPYQYGLPQTTQYVQNQARARAPNQPF